VTPSRSAAALIDADATVLVLYGDVPLITADAITGPRARPRGRAVRQPRWRRWSSRIPGGYGASSATRHGGVERVVETKTPGDATPEEEAIREVNTGIYAFAGGDLAAGAEGAARRQRAGRALPPDVLAAAARRGQGDRRARGDRRGADARRQHRVELAHVRGSPRSASTRHALAA
jgi:bifunctional UDP-N-acetylglucosamine pyrophosphorylase/glucosamine-1-phosphate N-acetyltransferase